MPQAIRTGVSLSARNVIEHLQSLSVIGPEHEARCQAVLALSAQIDLEQGRHERDPEAKGPTAALWTAYERLLAGLEALAPHRELQDDGMPSLAAVDDD